MLKDMKLKSRIMALTIINCLLFIVLFTMLVYTTGIDAIGGIALGGLVMVIILGMVLWIFDRIVYNAIYDWILGVA